MPPLGVSRKYYPISREMTTANDRGVDLSNPGNRRELRTAGDIVGPLPGPVYHLKLPRQRRQGLCQAVY